MEQVKFIKGCDPQILLGPFLNTLFHLNVAGKFCQLMIMIMIIVIKIIKLFGEKC